RLVGTRSESFVAVRRSSRTCAHGNGEVSRFWRPYPTVRDRNRPEATCFTLRILGLVGVWPFETVRTRARAFAELLRHVEFNSKACLSVCQRAIVRFWSDSVAKKQLQII